MSVALAQQIHDRDILGLPFEERAHRATGNGRAVSPEYQPCLRTSLQRSIVKRSDILPRSNVIISSIGLYSGPLAISTCSVPGGKSISQAPSM